MFELIKQQVSLLSELEKDLGVSFKQTGERNWIIDADKDVESCPFCGHHDCFKVTHVEGSNEGSFYKCFSCDAKGDVINWRAFYKNVPVGDAAKQLADEHNIQLPRNTNPIQNIFNLAAGHYHSVLMDHDKTLPYLGGLTPLDYQVKTRKRKLAILEKFKVGFSTGSLYDFLSGIGVDMELAEESGLVKDGRDYLPRNCFIYPHFVNGKASHFTFKDPLKKLAFQLPKKFSLNGYKFYNQDSIKDSGLVLIAEGENDVLSLMETGKSPATLGTIGQISSEQLAWLRDNCGSKKIITMFDPDGAGDKYRKKLEANRRYFKGLLHILPPNDMDIDELLVSGVDLEAIVRDNRVDISAEEKPEVSALDWEPPVEAPKQAQEPPISLSEAQVLPETSEGSNVVLISPDADKYSKLIGGASIPTNNVYVPPDIPEDQEVSLGGCAVFQKYGRYWRTTMKNDSPVDTPISDFILVLQNVYVKEDGDRQREVIVKKTNGKQSLPFMINSETKVSMKSFRILMAKILDCSWTGREQDFDAMWDLVYKNFNDREIHIPLYVGSHPATNGWLFRNVFIDGQGESVLPDPNGIFWSSDKKGGIKPQSIMSDGEIDSAIPELVTNKTKEETSFLMEGVIENLSKNLGSTGKALLSLGWIHSNVYSDMIFRHDHGMSMFVYWGKHGGGKSTIVGWLRGLLGLRGNVGKTSVVRLGSAVGFLRMASYYSSLPMFLDEMRSDEKSNSYIGMIRSWYDRESRPLASFDDSNQIRVQKLRSTLIIAAEDLPEDPATRERLVAVRMYKSDDPRRELVESYKWFEAQGSDLSCIGYQWIRESKDVNEADLFADIGKMELQLRAAGCSSRVAKKFAAAGYFGNVLAEMYCPGFNFLEYLVQESHEEQVQQTNDSTLSNFFELIEAMMARTNPRIEHGKHIRTEGDFLHLWFHAIFTEISAENRGKMGWSKTAIKRHIREEPYYVSDDKRVTMGVEGSRPAVITLDLRKATDTIKNIALRNE